VAYAIQLTDKRLERVGLVKITQGAFDLQNMCLETNRSSCLFVQREVVLEILLSFANTTIMFFSRQG
jgi:hypothetical protein